MYISSEKDSGVKVMEGCFKETDVQPHWAAFMGHYPSVLRCHFLENLV